MNLYALNFAAILSDWTMNGEFSGTYKSHVKLLNINPSQIEAH